MVRRAPVGTSTLYQPSRRVRDLRSDRNREKVARERGDIRHQFLPNTQVRPVSGETDLSAPMQMGARVLTVRFAASRRKNVGYSLFGIKLRQLDMLRAKPEAEQARRNAAQPRPLSEEP